GPAYGHDLPCDRYRGARRDLPDRLNGALRLHARRSWAERSIALRQRAADKLLLYLRHGCRVLSTRQPCRPALTGRLFHARREGRSVARPVAWRRYDTRETIRIHAVERNGRPRGCAVCALCVDMDAGDGRLQ